VEKLRKVESMEEAQKVLDEQVKITAEIKKLDGQAKIEREVSIGKGVWAIRGRITKTVKVTVIYTKPVDKEIREKTCQTVGNIARLWKEEAITTGGKIGILLVAPSMERKDETDWMVARVPKGVPNIEVFNKVVEGLKLDGWEKNGLVVKVFGEDKGRVVLKVPQGPVLAGWSKTEIVEQLRKENEGILLGGRLLKRWGKPRETGLEFTVENTVEAKRLALKGIRWNGHFKKVEIIIGETEKPLAGKKGYQPRTSGNRGNLQALWNQDWRRGEGGAGWRGKSAIKCFNCQGFGHKLRECSSAARKAAQRIEGVDKGKGKAVEVGFVIGEVKDKKEAVGNKRMMERSPLDGSPTPGPAPKNSEEKGEGKGSKKSQDQSSWEPTPPTKKQKKSWAEEMDEDTLEGGVNCW